uniref:Cell division cycle protein 123 n=1 Tax=Arundo donax TaxID=35708 RepID=A0A0A9F565_ARUDO
MSADGTIRCTCFAEVAMLLRASDCVVHDLVSARPSCEDFMRPEDARRNARRVSAAAEEGARPNACEGIGNEGVQPNDRGSGNDAVIDSRETGDEGGKRNAADCDVEDASEGESNAETWVDDGFQYYLALRKWYPGLRPESEFRCFVRHRKLVAVSQRDASAYYPSLLGWSSEVQPKIEAFFEEVVEPQFASENYTFDVYVRADGRVKLIDFNPWGGYTLPLLFTWEELEEEGRGQELEFRVVMQQGAVRPGLMTAVPYDMLDWGEESGWDVFLKKADEELDRQMNSIDGDS